MPLETLLGSYWKYPQEKLFPVSAIVADISRQNFSTMARGYYVDVLRRCRDCDSPFLFFAREQRHWYEDLGFYVDADCVRCPNCRSRSRAMRARVERFAEDTARDDLSDERLATHASDAAALWERGTLRDPQKLRRILNLALARIPGSRATRDLQRLVAGIGTAARGPKGRR